MALQSPARPIGASALNGMVDQRFWNELKRKIGSRLDSRNGEDACYRDRWREIRWAILRQQPELSGLSLHARVDRQLRQELQSKIGRPLDPDNEQDEQYRRRWREIRR